MKLLLVFVPLLLLGQVSEWREGEINGRRIRYQVVDGEALLGDILLGPASAFESEISSKETRRGSSVIIGSSNRWPDGVIPYVIDQDIPERSARVEAAIKSWNENTPIRLIPRTNEADYVQFRRRNGFACSSFIGKIGGRQYINLPDSCSRGSIVHEIGHAVGLFHTQSRHDRDMNVAVLPSAIGKNSISNFEIALQDGEDIGSYPFDSVMHYSTAGFALPGHSSMQTIPPGIPIGQRGTLSASDIDTVSRVYGHIPRRTTISTNPEGLQVTVDGTTIFAPASFDWVPGSTHSVSVEDQTVGGARAVFARWSNFGMREQTITASTDTTVFTAYFQRFFPFPTTSSPRAGGTVAVSPQAGSEGFPEGTVVQVEAIPGAGYQFSNWSGVGFFSLHGSANPIRVPLVDGELEYTASFSNQPLTTITSNPPGLRVVVDGTTVTTPRRYPWEPGSSHTISVATTKQTLNNEASQHVFSRWSSGSGETQTIKVPGNTITYTAEFDTRYRVLTDRFPTSSSGSISIDPPLLEDSYAPAGSTLHLTASPRSPYAFAGWSGDIRGTSPTIEVIVDREVAASAYFGLPRRISSSGTVNGASQMPGPVAPGEILTLYGYSIGPSQASGLQLNLLGRVEARLQNTRVLFNGIPAPLIYVSPHQINCVVPYGISGTSVSVQVDVNGQLTNSINVPVTAASPAFFTYNSSGLGGGAFLNENGSVNTRENPTERGKPVVLYATGIGRLTPAPQDGEVTQTLARPAAPIKVWIADREAVVEYAGPAPGLVSGVAQLNVRVPADITPGLVPVVLQVGETRSPRTVSLAVR